MKILCVIDHFGSGGAQRQLVNLACGLKDLGHEVEVFIYFPEYDFFRSKLEKFNIPIYEIHKGAGFSFVTLWRLCILLRYQRYDGAISFLSSPNIYLELAGTLAPETVIIASERSSHLGDRSRFTALLRRAVHMLSDRVATNSFSHAEWLSRYSWLRKKVCTVYNGYEITVNTKSVIPTCESELNLIAIGRIGPEKNCIALIYALSIFYRRYGFCPKISWVGRRDMTHVGQEYWKAIQEALKENPSVWENWNWLGERADVLQLVAEHHALIHPALFEGLPNVVCEALISGKPVLVSDVCDHSILVQDGIRGYLFDPRDPESIADAMHAINMLGDEGWRTLGENARRYAVSALSIDQLAASYERIIRDCHSGSDTARSEELA